MQWLRWLAAIVALPSIASRELSRLKRNTDPDNGQITYEVIPAIPTLYNVSGKVAGATNAASMAASEVYAADAEEKAQEALEATAESQVLAAHKQLESRLGYKMAKYSADESIIVRASAEDAAKNSRKMLHEIPIIAQQAAKDAVAEVIKKTIEKLNIEVNETAEKALKIEEEGWKKAGDRAQEEALPFQQAKLRAQQTAVEFAGRARELAEAVIPLKGKAMEIANSAQAFQDANNPVMAQQMLMKGHDLLDKALQYEGTAKGFASTANGINSGLGYYDLAANSAASWGAYQANPAGQRPDWPPPPEKLTLGPLKDKGKGKGKDKGKGKGKGKGL
jgi:hypothetical protein